MLGRVAWKNAARDAGAGLRRYAPYLLEAALVVLLLVQLVRFLFAVLTPVGPLGEWRGRHPVLPSAAARSALFRSFDAFYPASTAPAGPSTVTSLALSLKGIRVNESSGLGSAIIAGPDGVQTSYAVGDAIQPGVTLKAVAFDHVTLDRGGIEENLFIDQSAGPAKPGAPAGAAQPASPGAGGLAVAGQGAAAPGGNLTAAALKGGVGFGPRLSDGRVTGIVVTERGPGFASAGFRPGDVVTQVNGRPVGSAGDLSMLQQAVAPGARISLMVERGADVVPIAILVQGQ